MLSACLLDYPSSNTLFDEGECLNFHNILDHGFSRKRLHDTTLVPRAPQGEGNSQSQHNQCYLIEIGCIWLFSVCEYLW